MRARDNGNYGASAQRNVRSDHTHVEWQARDFLRDRLQTCGKAHTTSNARFASGHDITSRQSTHLAS